MKKIHVRYYAILRDATQKSEEILQTSAATAEQLYSELSSIYQKFLPASAVRVAINNQFRPMSEALSENDQVVFIPPVAGG